jgi:ribokinase
VIRPGSRRPEDTRFVVVGSYLADCVVTTRQFPDWGDDLRVEAVRTTLGGKALNQAVTLARHGAQVTALGVVGDDPTGRAILDGLGAESIDVDAMTVRPGRATPTCVVFTHPDDGRTAFAWHVPDVMAFGAADVRAARPTIAAADAVLITIDLPATAVAEVVRAARAGGTLVVVNPAPLPADPATIAAIPWEQVDVLVPNEAEARALLLADGPASGGPRVALPRALADHLRIPFVCVTLGEDGCAVWDGVDAHAHPAAPATVIDTTAASDAFIATLAVHLVTGRSAGPAVQAALRAAARTVGRSGGYDALPAPEDLR